MSDIVLDSREVEKILQIKPSSLRWLAEGIGLSHGRKGVARRWSLGELTSIVVAQQLADRGFTVQAATELARSFDERQFVRLVTDDEARLWAIAFPKGGGAFDIVLAKTSEDALAALQTGRDPILLNLRQIFEEAFHLVADARKEAGR